MSQDNRVDHEAFQRMIENLPPGEMERLNNLQHQQALDEYERRVSQGTESVSQGTVP